MPNEQLTQSEQDVLNTVQALMEAQGISFEDVNKMIKAASAGKREKIKIPKEVEMSYKGIATYTCMTCGYEFDNTFNTNKKHMHVTYAVDMCHECDARLLDYTKEELIEKIHAAYRIRRSK